MIIGGLLIAAWCYLLKAKNIINIVTPVIPIPNWVLGIVLAIGDVYGIITNAWDKSGTAPEVFIEDVEPSVNAPASISKPEPAPAPVSIPTPSVQNEAEKAAVMENAKKLQEANNIDLDKARDKAAEQALKQMEQSLKDMERISEMVGQEKLQEIKDAQGGSENSMNLEEAMAEKRKQIAELKSQEYGSENGSSSSEYRINR